MENVVAADHGPATVTVAGRTGPRGPEPRGGKGQLLAVPGWSAAAGSKDSEQEFMQ
jgi:hypothetical protein